MGQKQLLSVGRGFYRASNLLETYTWGTISVRLRTGLDCNKITIPFSAVSICTRSRFPTTRRNSAKPHFATPPRTQRPEWTPKNPPFLCNLTCRLMRSCVDLHAITLPHDPKELREATFRNAATYIAAGVDPEKSSIFVQSHVSAHAELCWLLSCCTPLGWLRRMVQYREKVKQREESGMDSAEEVGAGLLVYPALMAADILLYQADLVPVGQDQKQHLELARDLAHRTNTLFGGNKWKKRGGRGGRIFKIPEVMIPKQGARIMSLNDGTAKMSKSNPIENSRINVLDTPDDIFRKFKVAKTDSLGKMEWDNPDRPECRNLLTIYSIATGLNGEEVMKDIEGLSFGTFKPRLAEVVIEHLRPLQEKYKQLEADPGYVQQVLEKGAEQAEIVASRTLANCYDAMGFLPRTKQKL
eukprot:TRINITY_DN9513_c1_g1_i1.p1 TRINITY_DN9513_c1_g1~~TRINITY_DN9513_c1_g1_i1.p1  ORF type:complete len:413 (+),score=48.65 TRINITY_DN9513_c1_g1_i1:291-1529(+)